MKRVWWMLLVSTLSITTSAHAEKFFVGDQVYKTAEEARAAVDKNLIVWINAFNPNGLTSSGVFRVGGKAIFLMPNDEYIQEYFEKINKPKSILKRKKPTDNQEREFIRSIRQGIESTPLILSNLSYFDNITAVPFSGDPSLINLELFKADFVIYLQPDKNYDPTKDGLNIENTTKKVLHQFQNREISYVVKSLKNGKVSIFAKSTGNPFLFRTPNPQDVIKSLDISVRSIRD